MVQSLTLQSRRGTHEPIVRQRDIRRHRHVRRLHPELRPHQLDLHLHLREIARRLDRRLQIGRRVPREDGAVPDAGGQGRPVGQHGVRAGDQELVVLEPDGDHPGLEVVGPVVEDGERGLEAVGLVGRVRRRELGPAGIRVGEEDAVARVGGRRRREGGLGGAEGRGGGGGQEDEEDGEEGGHCADGFPVKSEALNTFLVKFEALNTHQKNKNKNRHRGRERERDGGRGFCRERRAEASRERERVCETKP